MWSGIMMDWPGERSGKILPFLNYLTQDLIFMADLQYEYLLQLLYDLLYKNDIKYEGLYQKKYISTKRCQFYAFAIEAPCSPA